MTLARPHRVRASRVVREQHRGSRSTDGMRPNDGGRGTRRPSLADGIRKELLLYVEDDDDNWEVAELRLSKSYDLVRAATDEQACRLIRERRAEIDVILMDIELRGSELNGFELTELL